MKIRLFFLAALLSAWLPLLAQESLKVWSLDAFGPLRTPAEAQAALEKASAAILAAKGGMLIIPREAPAGWELENISQGTWRNPPPPAPANRNWGNGPGLTVLDQRTGTVRVLVPEMTGNIFSRTLRLPEGQGFAEDSYAPLLRLENNVVRGTTSYRDWLLEDVQAGKDRRVYVRTIRGLFPGMFLNSGDYNNVQRLYVKSLGYDKAKGRPYFVADTDADLPAKTTLLHNKNHANALFMQTNANTENQTFDVFAYRHQYTQGGGAMYAGRFNYMGDVHSTNGDENGVIFAAFSLSETNVFRGSVQAVKPETNELTYTNAVNAQTLASGRPLIDMNPAKWVTGGKCYIFNPGGALLGWGGSIRSKDAPWTREVVGRYFALDEPDEYVPGTDKVRRWFLITSFNEENGIKMLSVQRHWWGAKNANSISRLYNPWHFSLTDDKPNLLAYIIAPGAMVYDVADGVAAGFEHANGARTRTVKIVPTALRGTAADFAPGDALEQAIGPDPFKPIAFRSWVFDSVPGGPTPFFDVRNDGLTSRWTVLWVNGHSPRYADFVDPKRPLPQISFGSIWDIQASCDTGIDFRRNVANAALLFKQPGNTPANDQMTQLRWENPRATLGVTDQGMLLMSLPVDVAGKGLASLQGISGSREPGSNLRGLQVPVDAGATKTAIVLRVPEKSAAYGVVVQPSWSTAHAVTAQTAAGFTVDFSTPAPAGASLNWVLMR
jgi:hypothetical protein